MNVMLLHPIQDTEVKKAAIQLGALKALGPDGFPGMVNQFISQHNKEWKDGFIKGILNAQECKAILAIPITKFLGADRRVWRLASIGVFRDWLLQWSETFDAAMGRQVVHQFGSSYLNLNSSGLFRLISLWCDGAFKKGKATVGVILKGYNGTLEAGIGKHIPTVFSRFSKAAAIHEACLLASASRLRNVTIPSDNLEKIVRVPASFGIIGMESLINKIRNLDAYPKINEDFYSRTLSGGVITVASSILMLLLFISELRLYLHAVTETKLVVDTSRGETLRINFDVTFPALPCSILSVDAMDISGEQHLDVRHDIIKKRIDAHGNVIEARQEGIGAPKIDRPLQRHGGRLEHNETYCGSCYGAEAAFGKTEKGIVGCCLVLCTVYQLAVR
ncbi:unnamed protein product [Ilex paraguariensis]|uniref:Endoplasmic reticulum vesicle transporter N-terminal domain-containing protein n=1 Tax=Ilex paraguariensis TaxID=185542 RepID=A0ABC8SI18_9AQUA